MALLFYDGFDYNDANATRWNITVPSRVTSQFRTGTHSISSTAQRDIGLNLTTFILGCATRRSSIAGDLYRFLDGTTAQLTLVVLANGAIEVRRGTNAGTLLGTTAAGVFLPNAWNYIEVKATIDNTAGSVEIRLNGVTTPILNLTGQDTQNTANAFITRYALQDNNHDDHYLCDTSGALNNDFLGDARVEVLYPNGAGNYTEWTPSTGSNFQNVDEPQTPNGDTDYNSSSTPNQRDTFAMANLATTSGSVKGVQMHLNARKDDAGAREIATMIRSGTTDVQGATQSLTTSYAQYDSAIFQTDPNTAAAWTIANVNALEAGYKEIT